jgi:hypothetical protein
LDRDKVSLIKSTGRKKNINGNNHKQYLAAYAWFAIDKKVLGVNNDYVKVCKAVDDVCEKHGLGRPNKTESKIKNTYMYQAMEFNLAWIKDILVIARLKDETPGPKGLPQNMLNSISVDTQYEITVFNKMASDLLFNKLGQIIERDTVKAIMEMSPDGQVYIKRDKKER